MTQAASPHVYRDAQFNTEIKALRATIRGDTEAQKALQRVEQRLKFQERVIAAHDAKHAAQAEQLLAEGHYERASTLAALIWHTQTREGILQQVQQMRAPTTDEAAERMAEAVAFGRVIE